MSLLVANLDAELALARASTPGPHRRLPAQVSAAVAPASAWMALLGRPGDRLWTMAPIEAAAVERIAPGVEAVSGALAARPGEAVLAWCETEEIAALRREAAAAPAAAEPRGWVDALWGAVASPEAAARANDRRLSAAVAAAIGAALPGSRVLSSVPELEAHLAAAPLGAGDAWVAKAPWSAAGRERLRRRGRVLDAEARVRAERLVGRYGQLCFEPWVERVADLGRAGVMAGDDLLLFAPHRMECDRAGIVRAVLVDDEGVTGALAPEHRQALDQAAEAAAAALRQVGYRGAFSVDAFVYRRESGAAIQPLVEINARLSFGHLARAAAERAGGGRYRLALGGP